MFQRLAKNKWVSRFRLNLFKHLKGVMVFKGKDGIEYGPMNVLLTA